VKVKRKKQKWMKSSDGFNENRKNVNDDFVL
jgi:hypothetical protein